MSPETKKLVEKSNEIGRAVFEMRQTLQSGGEMSIKIRQAERDWNDAMQRAAIYLFAEAGLELDRALFMNMAENSEKLFRDA